MSDGLIAPLNAPPAGAAVPGIQPGTSGIDLARVVIVFGPAGTISGVFEYEPGTAPGPGNPPVVAITASTTDPYANPIPGGSVPRIVVQQSGGTGPYALLTSSDPLGQVGLLFPSRATEELTAAEINLQIENPGTNLESLITNITGPAVSPRGDFVDIGLTSGSKDGTEFAQAFYEYNDGAGNFYEVVTIQQNGALLPYVAELVGQQPGATVPTSDIFHSMAPLGTGFNVTGNNFNGDPCYAEYTYEPMGPSGSVHVRGNINVTAGPGAAFKLLTATSLPAGYRPKQARYFQVAFNEDAIVSGSNDAQGLAVLETSGAIFVYGGASAAADSCLVFEATIRLD